MPHALTFIKNFNCHLLHSPSGCLNSCTWPQNNTQLNIHKPQLQHPPEGTNTKEKPNNPKFAKLATLRGGGAGFPTLDRQMPLATCHLPIFRCASENPWYALPTIFQAENSNAPKGDDDTWQLFCFFTHQLNPPPRSQALRKVCNFPFSTMPDLAYVARRSQVRNLRLDLKRAGGGCEPTAFAQIT